MNKELRKIMDRHQHCAHQYISSLEWEYFYHPELLFNILKEEALHKSGLPPDDVVFIHFIVVVSDDMKIIAVTADHKDYNAYMSENN